MSELRLQEQELERLLVIKQIILGRMTQEAGSEALKLSARQIRRLVKRIRLDGSSGIRSRHTGGNRQFDANFKEEVMSLVRSKYHDFGPKFASEKLAEVDNLAVNRETLRQWMMECGLWHGRSRRKARIHQSRERRARFGELVQIDGSHHDWFEGRAAKCCLLVFIDDATSKLVGLRFEAAETTQGYLKLIKQHLMEYGRPLAYYSDKHSIFRTNRDQDCLFQDTQVQRALRELQIELIHAHSSQAKGRVERSNQTLQDRLVKEMRLRNISDINAANEFLKDFIIMYNKKFAVPPDVPEDAHRALYHSQDALRRILSVQHERKLSKNLEFSFEGKLYQVKTTTTGYRLRHQQVQIYEYGDDSLEVVCNGQRLEHVFIAQRFKNADTKDINNIVDILSATNSNKNYPTISSALG